MDDGTYAEQWAGAINDTYTGAYEQAVNALAFDGVDDEAMDAAIQRALTKAAQCLRNGVPATFTAGELDVVRYLMPVHEVHQSVAMRRITEMYGPPD